MNSEQNLEWFFFVSLKVKEKLFLDENLSKNSSLILHTNRTFVVAGWFYKPGIINLKLCLLHLSMKHKYL